MAVNDTREYLYRGTWHISIKALCRAIRRGKIHRPLRVHIVQLYVMFSLSKWYTKYTTISSTALYTKKLDKKYGGCMLFNGPRVYTREPESRVHRNLFQKAKRSYTGQVRSSLSLLTLICRKSLRQNLLTTSPVNFRGFVLTPLNTCCWGSFLYIKTADPT